MRNPERLDNFYDEVRDLHKEVCPDWRFSQLIINFQRWIAVTYGIRDIFFIEEEEMIKYIRKFAEGLK